MHHMATTVTNLVAILDQAKLIKYLPSICLAALLPVAIFHLLQINTSEGPVRLEAMHGYSLCVSVVKQMQAQYTLADHIAGFIEAAKEKLDPHLV